MKVAVPHMRTVLLNRSSRYCRRKNVKEKKKKKKEQNQKSNHISSQRQPVICIQHIRCLLRIRNGCLSSDLRLRHQSFVQLICSEAPEASIEEQ